MAERMGLILKLDLWAIAEALGAARGWADPLSKVSVNLSAAALQDPRIADRIAGIVEASGQPPGRLLIEVAESAMMVDPAQARRSLDRLHEMGITIAIDDFGTGYSSLAYLKNLPVDEVKIDQSFVREMATLERDVCIVRAVVDLGHNLCLRVTAEGVEDAASLALLASLGCDHAQGYHIARPLCPAAYPEWIASSPLFPVVMPRARPGPHLQSRPRWARHRRRLDAAPGGLAIAPSEPVAIDRER